MSRQNNWNIQMKSVIAYRLSLIFAERDIWIICKKLDRGMQSIKL